MIPVYGGITIQRLSDLALVTLTTDPETYDPYDWPKRQSETEVIGGRRVYQVAPKKYAVDRKIHIASGATQWWNKDLVQTLMAWDAATGETFEVTDYEGNVYTALITLFHPVKDPRMPDLYTATLELSVVTVTTLLGIPYTLEDDEEP